MHRYIEESFHYTNIQVKNPFDAKKAHEHNSEKNFLFMSNNLTQRLDYGGVFGFNLP